jgi:methyl-accepting chemotaxis protein
MKRFTSLRSRLLVAVLAAGALILTVVGVTSYITTRNVLVEEAKIQARTLAQKSALAITNELGPLYTLPDTLAAAELRTVDGKSRLQNLREILPGLQASRPRVRNLFVFYERQVVEGREYASVWYNRQGERINPAYPNVPGEPGYDPSQKLDDYFSEDWYIQGLTAKSTIWTEPYIEPITKVAVVSVLSPIRRGDTPLGVAGLDVDIEGLQQIVASVHPTERSYALLISRDGTFMANPYMPASVMTQKISDLAKTLESPSLEELGKTMTNGQEGLLDIIDPQTGEIAWAAYQPVPNTGWSIAVVIPQQDLLAGVSQLQRRMVLLAVGGLALLALLLFFLARSIADPITLLTQAVERMAHGDLSHRVTIHRNDETGLLASSFNTLAQTLEEQIAAERQAQAEAQRLQQIEVENRQMLEATVAEYLRFAQQVAQGDLTKRLPVMHDGTLGQLGEGLNQMVASLQSITAQVQHANSAIAAAAAEILAATTQQAASAAEQSAAISQTTTTVAEVKAIAQQTAQQALQVAQESQALLTAAQQGATAVEETIGGMRQVHTRVESIATTILALSEQAQAIDAIITTVSELADQSNLLALNAAIEAARAGEHGKSFAVVAQHVRELAERSKGATGQVREILGEIQRATHAAVLVTEEGTKGTVAGNAQAVQAGQVIHRITGEVEVGAQANVQMAAAAQQQTAGMEQIGQAMQSIQQATTQTVASTRQAERAAQDLYALAQSLQSAIAAYQL